MNDNHKFEYDPRQYGLPDVEKIKEYRIWDTHYHGFLNNLDDPFPYNEKMLRYVRRMGIERVISVDIGGTLSRPIEPKPFDDRKRKFLEEHTDTFSGIIPIDPGFPEESVQKMVDWIENGPCIGIKYVGGNQLGITCDHPNNDAIIQKAIDLKAVIYIHTWIKTAGDPRMIGEGNLSGENAPTNLFRRIDLLLGRSLVTLDRYQKIHSPDQPFDIRKIPPRKVVSGLKIPVELRNWYSHYRGLHRDQNANP